MRPRAIEAASARRAARWRGCAASAFGARRRARSGSAATSVAVASSSTPGRGMSDTGALARDPPRQNLRRRWSGETFVVGIRGLLPSEADGARSTPPSTGPRRRSAAELRRGLTSCRRSVSRSCCSISTGALEARSVEGRMPARRCARARSRDVGGRGATPSFMVVRGAVPAEAARAAAATRVAAVRRRRASSPGCTARGRTARALRPRRAADGSRGTRSASGRSRRAGARDASAWRTNWP